MEVSIEKRLLIRRCQKSLSSAINQIMKDDAKQTFGQAVKTMRKKLNLTQEGLAEKIHTSYKYMQRIEGKNPPDIRLSTINRLSKALKTTPSELLSYPQTSSKKINKNQ